jgi:hypothetical protein
MSPHAVVMLYSSSFTMFGTVVIVSIATRPITNFQSLFSLYLLSVLTSPLLHLIFSCCLCPQIILSPNYNKSDDAFACCSSAPLPQHPAQVLSPTIKLLPPMPSVSLPPTCIQPFYTKNVLINPSQSVFIAVALP